MPGLGWVLTRNVFEKELLPIWPPETAYFDWDMWLRQKHILKNRDCIIPDLSRTKHIGIKGVNIHPGFQTAYFSNKAFSFFNFTHFNAEIVRAAKYEKLMNKLM
uniref:Alpha-1,3-mannosyl-glycoprotein 2-beta-N-acetylglucosaminyltransferase n=1 Tax=Henneguya salminicola TaxID=69463 RepID=A0A6G3MFW2_HENSL